MPTSLQSCNSPSWRSTVQKGESVVGQRQKTPPLSVQVAWAEERVPDRGRRRSCRNTCIAHRNACESIVQSAVVHVSSLVRYSANAEDSRSATQISTRHESSLAYIATLLCVGSTPYRSSMTCPTTMTISGPPSIERTYNSPGQMYSLCVINARHRRCTQNASSSSYARRCL